MKYLKAIGWFVFLILFVGNSIITIRNYHLIKVESSNKEMIISNKAIIQELIKKVVPDEKALKERIE